MLATVFIGFVWGGCRLVMTEKQRGKDAMTGSVVRSLSCRLTLIEANLEGSAVICLESVMVESTAKCNYLNVCILVDFNVISRHAPLT